MKNIAKVMISVSMVAGLLAISHMSFAAPSKGISKRLEMIKFIPDSNAPASCQKLPPALVYTFMDDHNKDQKSLHLQPGSAWKWFVIEDSEQIGDTTDFIDTAVLISDIRHPYHLHGHVKARTAPAKGFYWQWQQDGSRCFGTFEVLAAKGQ